MALNGQNTRPSMLPRMQGGVSVPPTGYPRAQSVVTSAQQNIRHNTQYQQLMYQPGYQDTGSTDYNGQNALMCMVQQIQQTNTVLLSRLSSIEANVSRLGKIEQDVSSVRSEMSLLKLDNIALNAKCVDLEKSCQFISDKYDKYTDSEKKQSETIQNLRCENSLLWREIDKSKSNYQKAQDEIQELKARSMQENLLFFGLCEGQNEDTEFKLRQFLTNELEFDSESDSERRVENIVFDRVHRLGRRRGDGIRNPRPIVAKFERYRDRELIRLAGLELNKKRGQFSIREQFPVEMEAKRKRLYPVMRKYQQNKNNKVVLVRDKLFVNGLLYDEDTGDLIRPARSNSINNRNFQPETREHNDRDLTDNRPTGTPRRVLKANRPSVSFEHKNTFGILSEMSEQEADISFVNEAAGTKRKPSSPAFNETLAKKTLQNGKSRAYSDDDSIVDMEAGQITVSVDVHHSASNEMDATDSNNNGRDENVTTSGETLSTGDTSQGEPCFTHHDNQNETTLTTTSNLIVSSMRVNRHLRTKTVTVTELGLRLKYQVVSKIFL